MWEPKEIGEKIAERELTFTDGKIRRLVTLRVGKPVREPAPEEGSPWWCPIEIEGLGSTKIYPAAGVDALQALLLSLYRARDVLPTLAKGEGGEIFWLTEDFDSVFDQREPLKMMEIRGSELRDGLKAALAHITEMEENHSRRQEVVSGIEAILKKWDGSTDA